MLEHSPSAAETVPANTSPALLATAAREPAAESEIAANEAGLAYQINVVAKAPNRLLRYYLAEQNWTVACISSMTFHLSVLIAVVLGSLLWNLLGMGSFLPPGATAGGRPAGSNAAGVIGLAPGRTEDLVGDAELTGGIITLFAPERMGNLAAAGEEVPGEVLEAQKYVLTQSQTRVVEVPTNEPVPPLETSVAAALPSAADRVTAPPPPPDFVPPEPATVVARRAPPVAIPPAFAVQPDPALPETQPAEEIVPRVAITRGIDAATAPVAAPTMASQPELAVTETTPLKADRADLPDASPDSVPVKTPTTVARRTIPVDVATTAPDAVVTVARTAETEPTDEPTPQVNIARTDAPTESPAAEPAPTVIATTLPFSETLVEKAEKSEKEISDAPLAENDSNGLARQRGTRVIAKTNTQVELDFPGQGGGAGGPGGNGGAGGRGGATNDGPGGTGTGMTHGGNGDLRSLVLSAPEPIYPRELVEARIVGRVSVRVEIDREGKVVSVRVHQASGYDAFDRSALEAIARWKFARLADKPWRGSVYIVPVRFKIY